VCSDHIFIFLNILFLMCVAFIPFPTALLAEYIESEERTTAVTVYTGTLALTAVFFTLLWHYAANGYRLVNRNLDPGTLQAMTRRYVAGMALYIFTFVNVVLSLALVVGLALLFVLPEPGSRPRESPHSGGDAADEEFIGKPPGEV
jgi:uncharacterized membrane protein